MEELVAPDIRLLAIAGPPHVDRQALVAACRAAEAGGATAVQLRWKRDGAAALLRLAESVVAAVTIPVFVNDRADVALAAGAAGVHLGADDIPAHHVRAMAPHPFAIGVSVGTPDEATRTEGADVDYWSVGSIYATLTKPDAGVPIGPAGFRALAARAPATVPVIAIGGIDSSNAQEILDAGARGIAVASAIFGARDVERATRRLRAIVDREVRPSAQPER